MDFMGMQFVWWQGVVEDINDPKEAGRVRVRVLGFHSEKTVLDEEVGEGIPVNALPWAWPMTPIDNAAMNGIGKSPTGIVEGTWVFGFARDGMQMQHLVIMGTLPGIPQEKPKTDGFKDPNGVYPRDTHLGEPDVNRLARNKKIDQTIVQTKKDGVDQNVPTANGGSWSEPATQYAAKYPKNHVYESESGHITEFDDTPGKERIHVYHKTGTFHEIFPDGTKVEKIVKDNYEIILGNDFIHIKGNTNVTVDGSSKVYIKGNADLRVGGNVVQNIGGNATQTVQGNVTETINGGSKSTTVADAYITGNLHVTGDVNDKNGTMKEMRDAFNGHNHIGNLDVPTSPPQSQMT